MKKLFSIFAITMVIGLLSSCVIVAHEEPKYTLTFVNNLANSSRNDIFDWYAKNDSGSKYVVSKYATHVTSGGGISKLRDLYKDDYCVIFTFDDTTDDYDGDKYYKTDFFRLDQDLDFVLEEATRTYTVTVRSVGNPEETTEEVEKGYQLVASDGTVYPLTKVEE